MLDLDKEHMRWAHGRDTSAIAGVLCHYGYIRLQLLSSPGNRAAALAGVLDARNSELQELTFTATSAAWPDTGGARGWIEWK